MGYTRQTYLYELLVRFDKNGLVGMHAIEIEELVDDETDEVLVQRQLDARTISQEEGEEYLGKANIEALASLDEREKVFAEAVERLEKEYQKMEHLKAQFGGMADAVVKTLTNQSGL